MAVGQHKHILRAHSAYHPTTPAPQHSEKNKQFHKICGKWKSSAGKYLNIYLRDRQRGRGKGKRTTAGEKRKMQNKHKILRWHQKGKEGDPGDETLCRQRK